MLPLSVRLLVLLIVITRSAQALAAEVEPREFFADQPKGLGEHYTAWKASYVGELLGNIGGGLEQGAIYEGYLKAGWALNLEKLFGWDNTVFYVNLLATHGDSLTDKYVGDLNVVSNIDAYDSLRIFKLFLQRNFDHSRCTIRLGIIAVDKDFFVSQGASLFLNSGFGAFPVIGQNLNAPIYPVSAPGIRLTWNPSDAFGFRAAIFSGDVGSPISNPHGTRWTFSGENGVAAFFEGAQKTTLAGELHGTYRSAPSTIPKTFVTCAVAGRAEVTTAPTSLPINSFGVNRSAATLRARAWRSSAASRSSRPTAISLASMPKPASPTPVSYPTAMTTSSAQLFSTVASATMRALTTEPASRRIMRQSWKYPIKLPSIVGSRSSRTCNISLTPTPSGTHRMPSSPVFAAS